MIPFICDCYIVSFSHFKQFKTLANSGIEFAEKLNRANDTVEFIIEQIGLDIDEIKKNHGVLADIGTKMAGVILGTMFFTPLLVFYNQALFDFGFSPTTRS